MKNLVEDLSVLHIQTVRNAHLNLSASLRDLKKLQAFEYFLQEYLRVKT